MPTATVVPELTKTRAEAWELLCEFTTNKNLLKHALAVEAAMRHYARHFKNQERVSLDAVRGTGEQATKTYPVIRRGSSGASDEEMRLNDAFDEEVWGIVGLLHDFDYERYPSLDDHPYKGQVILEERGYPEVVRRGIMAHAPHTGTDRQTLLEKAIFAVDELTGFIVAVALIKPNKSLAEVDVKSVKKKMKQKAFAAPVSREDIQQGAQELGLTLDEHIEHVLQAMQEIADELGL